MDLGGACVRIGQKDHDFNNLFDTGLEYNAPSRGPWNIVHTGMLIPESHQIFACAAGCLRGVILTAAEMNAMERMSWISVQEEDMYDGTMEQDIFDGSVDIIEKMIKKPKAVLLFISCIHLFAGIDFMNVIERLNEKYKDICFIDCYMNPTMRKSGLTPDQLCRRQMYKPLIERALKKSMENTKKTDAGTVRAVNIIGNDRPTDESSELIKIIKSAGYVIRDISLCKSYDEFLEMSESNFNITYTPSARPAGDGLKRAIGQPDIYIPLSYGYKEIKNGYHKLAEKMNIMLPEDSFRDDEKKADEALNSLRKTVGNTPVVIDYTATPRPLGLARLLLEHGFNVKYVFADVFSDEEHDDFDFLREKVPDLLLCSTLNVKMRFVKSIDMADKEPNDGKILAIGQKAAYFAGTDNFVNIVQGGGMYGFDGIVRLAGLMDEAFRVKKDRRSIIQKKGLGCESCL
jgi:hypothetical protein